VMPNSGGSSMRVVSQLLNIAVAINAGRVRAYR
jgi:hypothetical protein